MVIARRCHEKNLETRALTVEATKQFLWMRAPRHRPAPFKLYPLATGKAPKYPSFVVVWRFVRSRIRLKCASSAR
ncbi:MAG: hypothetical protein ACYTFI_03645 [Planctomycetota bacterium]